jgi:hypothetical protein
VEVPLSNDGGLISLLDASGLKVHGVVVYEGTGRAPGMDRRVLELDRSRHRLVPRRFDCQAALHSGKRERRADGIPQPAHDEGPSLLGEPLLGVLHRAKAGLLM